MIVCTKCGAENPDGTGFCVSCGRYLDWHGARLEERAGSAVSATLKTPDLAVEPGGQAVAEIEVHNEGRLVDEYRLNVTGPDPSWCSVEPLSLRLMPKTSGASRVLFRPPRASSPPASTIPFVVTVSSTVDPSVNSEVAGSVTVTPFTEVVATLVPQTSESPRIAEHTVRIENQGNAPNRITLAAQDADDKLSYDLSPSDLTLAAGVPGEAHVFVRPRNPHEPRGGRRLPFRVLVQPANGATIRLDGATVLLEPSPAWWGKWRLALGGALALTLLTALVAWAGPPYPHWPPLPQPTLSGTRLLPSPSPSTTPPPSRGTLQFDKHPPSYNFGTVQIGSQSQPFVFTVTNTGAGKTTLGASVSGTNATEFRLLDSCGATPLEPGGQCELQVQLAPQSPGSKSGSLNFAPDNAAAPDSVQLTGIATGSGRLTCSNLSSPLQIKYSYPTPDGYGTLTCTNSGTGDLTITSVSFKDQMSLAGFFTKQSDACSGQTLKPSDKCAVVLRFTTATTNTWLYQTLVINYSTAQMAMNLSIPLQGYRSYR